MGVGILLGSCIYSEDQSHIFQTAGAKQKGDRNKKKKEGLDRTALGIYTTLDDVMGVATEKEAQLLRSQNTRLKHDLDNALKETLDCKAEIER